MLRAFFVPGFILMKLENLRTQFPAMVLTSFLITGLSISGCSTDDTSTPSSITTTDSEGETSVDSNVLKETLGSIPVEPLSMEETEGLVYMREEEKLARDTYIAMFSLWNANIFNNISTSEQTHTDAVLALLQRYNITDPVGSNPAGVFTDATLQGLYDTLTAQGSASLVDGLIVGAVIEELDLIDIQEQIDNVVDNQDITLAYENLLKGSRNHLRAFISTLTKQSFSYVPQYLSQQVFDEIINSEIE